MRNLLGSSTTLMAMTFAGCAGIPPDSELVDAAPAQTIEIALEPGDRLRLSVPSGELRVNGADTDTVRGTLTIRCPADSRKCMAWAADAALVATRRDDQVRVALNKGPKLNVAVKAEIEIPRGVALDVSHDYGDLVIHGMEDDVFVRMKAGALSVAMPDSAVANVRASARFGDSSLRVAGRNVEGSRSMLVGAKVQWAEGRGEHDVDVHVRYGDAQVEVYSR